MMIARWWCCLGLGPHVRIGDGAVNGSGGAGAVERCAVGHDDGGRTDGHFGGTSGFFVFLENGRAVFFENFLELRSADGFGAVWARMVSFG